MTDSHMRERTEAKREAVEAIDDVLAQLETEKREPSTWERICILSAINNTYAGIYEMVELELEEVSTPPAVQDAGSDEIYAAYSLSRLRKELRTLSGAPVREFPAFGGVKLAGDG